MYDVEDGDIGHEFENEAKMVSGTSFNIALCLFHE
jgi:hypothetical protein